MGRPKSLPIIRLAALALVMAIAVGAIPLSALAGQPDEASAPSGPALATAGNENVVATAPGAGGIDLSAATVKDVLA